MPHLHSEGQNHVIISLDAEKTLQNPTRFLNILGVEGTCLNTRKTSSDRPTAHIKLNVKNTSVFHCQEHNKDTHFSTPIFNRKHKD